MRCRAYEEFFAAFLLQRYRMRAAVGGLDPSAASKRGSSASEAARRCVMVVTLVVAGYFQRATPQLRRIDEGKLGTEKCREASTAGPQDIHRIRKAH